MNIAKVEALMEGLKKDISICKAEEPKTDLNEERFSRIAMTFDVFAKALTELKKETRVNSAEPKAEHTTRFVKAVGLEKVTEDENGELRIVSGIVLEPDISDSQGDTYTADEIRKTAHLYMLDFQNISRQHKQLINDQVGIVESYIAPVDMEVEGQKVTKGTWVLTVKVYADDLWESIKKGDVTGFSIGGFAKRIPLS